MHTANINEYVGKAIRNLRLSKDLTLNEVATKVKISYQQLQKYEKGTNRLSIDKLYNIAKILGMDIYNFFPGTEMSFDRDNLQKLAVGDSFANITDEESRQLILKLMEKLSAPKQPPAR